MDRNTASAGEILAGALLLWYEETIHIVGERTYGKGVYSDVVRDGEVEIAVTGGAVVAGELGVRALSIQGTGIGPTVPFDKPAFPLSPLEPRYDRAAQIGLRLLGNTDRYSDVHPLRRLLMR